LSKPQIDLSSLITTNKFADACGVRQDLQAWASAPMISGLTGGTEMNSSIFKELKEFIADKRKMQTTHIYKPVMIQAVLRNGGAASREEIAKAILSRDTSQIEYYRRYCLR
jgi:hypothetical protein